MTRNKRAQALRITKPYTSYPGHSGYKRVQHDYCREPKWAVDQLLQVETFTGSIYDPCCGGGTIPARCRAHGLHADGSDLQSIAGCKVQDVFTITAIHDNHIANPPYDLAEEAIRYLLPLTSTSWPSCSGPTFCTASGGAGVSSRLCRWPGCGSSVVAPPVHPASIRASATILAV